MEQRKFRRLAINAAMFILLLIPIDIAARYLYKLSWFSNVTIGQNVNIPDIILSLLGMATTVLIAWYITKKLSSNRFEKELAVEELKELIVSIRDFKKSDKSNATAIVTQQLLDDGAYVFQTINTFHPNVDTIELKNSSFNLFGASTDAENIDPQLINQHCNTYILKIKECIKEINK